MISIDATLSTAGASMATTSPTARPEQAARDFEALFIETLLQHAGLAQSLESQDSAEGSVFGEMMVRELARDLAGQLHLGFGEALGAVAQGASRGE